MRGLVSTTLHLQCRCWCCPDSSRCPPACSSPASAHATGGWRLSSAPSMGSSLMVKRVQMRSKTSDDKDAKEVASVEGDLWESRIGRRVICLPSVCLSSCSVRRKRLTFLHSGLIFRRFLPALVKIVYCSNTLMRRWTFLLLPPQVCQVLRKMTHYLKLVGPRLSTVVPLLVQNLDHCAARRAPPPTNSLQPLLCGSVCKGAAQKVVCNRPDDWSWQLKQFGRIRWIFVMLIRTKQPSWWLLSAFLNCRCFHYLDVCEGSQSFRSS